MNTVKKYHCKHLFTDNFSENQERRDIFRNVKKTRAFFIDDFSCSVRKYSVCLYNGGVMERMSRMDVRIPLDVREVIDMAASLEGRTRTDFLVEAGIEKARKVIEEHKVIKLSMRDQKILAEALTSDAVKEPDKFFKGLTAKYREIVVSE